MSLSRQPYPQDHGNIFTSPHALIVIICNTSRLPPKAIEFTPQHNLILTMAKTLDKIAKDKMKMYGDTKR